MKLGFQRKKPISLFFFTIVSDRVYEKKNREFHFTKLIVNLEKLKGN